MVGRGGGQQPRQQLMRQGDTARKPFGMQGGEHVSDDCGGCALGPGNVFNAQVRNSVMASASWAASIDMASAHACWYPVELTAVMMATANLSSMRSMRYGQLLVLLRW
jgi:hypothetical protein